MKEELLPYGALNIQIKKKYQLYGNNLLSENIKSKTKKKNQIEMQTKDNLHTTTVSEIMSNEGILRSDGIIVLDNRHTRLMNTCAQRGFITIKPHPLMNPNLIVQSIANLNRSVVITTSEIWDTMKNAKKHYPDVLDHLSILLLA